VGVQVEGPGTASQTTVPADRLKEIQAAVEASPSKIAVIFLRDHQVPGKSMHASEKFKFDDGKPSWDHVAIAWMDKSGNLVFAEARPANGPVGVVFFGKNSPGTATEAVTEYKDFKVLPIDLGRYGPGARDAFVNTVTAATRPGSFYSATNKNIGTICSGAVEKGFEAAREAQKPTPPVVKYLKESFQRVSTLGLNFTKLNLYTPKKAYLEAAKHSVPHRFDPKAPLVKREWSVVGQQPKITVVIETDNTEANQFDLNSPMSFNAVDQRSNSLRTNALSASSLELSSVALALQSATGQGTQTSQDELQDHSDDEDDENDEDALIDGSQQSGTDDDEDEDEDALEQEVTLASDPEHTPPHPAQPPETDEDEGELILVSDPEDARTDGQQPAIDDDDDDEEPLQADDEEEEPEDASDAEDAPTADALMQAAKAEAGADATADGQAGPALATSAPVTADDGFSFSLFPKPVPTEVAAEALPAEQASPVEGSPGSGLPGSESADPGLDSANVGNAAPGHERVVHHGDLAP
jgi:hypothetical protein